MVHADKATGELHRSQFGHWVARHCPRLLEGIRQWTKSLLLPQEDASHKTEEQGATTEATTLTTKLPYQLPVAQTEKSERPLEREVEVCTLIWALSTVLPMMYLGQKDAGKTTPKVRILVCWRYKLAAMEKILAGLYRESIELINLLIFFLWVCVCVEEGGGAKWKYLEMSTVICKSLVRNWTLKSSI